MSTPWSVRILGLVQFALEQGLSEAMTEVAPQHPQLRQAHLRVFRHGSLDSVRITELARRSGMTKQSMHELVGHLQRHGYLSREPDPADSRAHQVRLTAWGRELEGQLRAASARVHLRWRDQLGQERFAVLWSALQEVTGRDDPQPDPGELARQAAAHPSPVSTSPVSTSPVSTSPVSTSPASASPAPAAGTVSRTLG